MKDEFKPVIGLITHSSFVPEKEFHECLPQDVHVVTTRLAIKNVTYDGVQEMISRLPEAVETIMVSAPSVITITSMSGSCMMGERMTNPLEQQSGVPVLSPAVEAVKLLKQLGCRDIIMICLLGTELGFLEKYFFGKNEINMIKIINIIENFDGRLNQVDMIDTEEVMEKISRIDFNGAQAVIFDSPAVQFVKLSERLESMINIPILSSNQILMYAALKRIGISTEGLYIHKFFTQ